jgi:hypothetical protein
MAALSAAQRHHRARIAALSRDRDPDDPDLRDAKQSFAYAGLAEHAEKVVADWPTPPPEVLNRVAAILRSGGVA